MPAIPEGINFLGIRVGVSRKPLLISDSSDWWPWRCPPLTPLVRLLADAEAAENMRQQVVGGSTTGDFLQPLRGSLQVGQHELF